jgi:hypothetical protein
VRIDPARLRKAIEREQSGAKGWEGGPLSPFVLDVMLDLEEARAALEAHAMKSLPDINRDNRLTNRDCGGMCTWWVFNHGDLLGGFVKEADAREFASNYEYEHDDSEIVISESQP